MTDMMSVAGQARVWPAPTSRSPDKNFVLLLLSLLLLDDCASAANVTPERRISSRIVTTKYGALRGFLITLPNRSLQPVEAFMGKAQIDAPFCADQQRSAWIAMHSLFPAMT